MIISAYYAHLLSASEQTGRSVFDVAKECFKQGITGVDVIYSDINDESIENIRKMKEYGFTVCSMPVQTDFVHVPSEKAADEFIEWAKKLGATVIMSIPGVAEEGEDKEALRQKSLPAIKYMASKAAEYGIKVGVEDYDDYRSAVAGIEGIEWYLKALPELHCIFDTGNFIYMGDDTLEAYNKFKDKILYQIHCNDKILTNPQNAFPRKRATGVEDYPAAVGTGIIPIEEILKDLISNGFDGIITIENFGSKAALQDLITSAQNIQKIINE